MGMTFDEYQHLAARTINKELTTTEMLNHGLFGMAAEAGEVCGIYQKSYQGHAPTIEHIIKEIGDELWFLAEICTALDIPLGDVAQMNIDKLKARFPNGFDPERSLHRAEGDI